MTTCIIAFVAALAVALVATQGVRRFALRIGAVDVPDRFRKLHDGQIPRLGGIAIFVAFLFSLLALYILNPYVLNYILDGHRMEAMGCLLGGATALLIGVLDDLYDLRPRNKLLWQLVPASMAYMTGCSIGAVSLPFLGHIELGWLSLPITVLWFLCCMNAVNLLDGLDGLAAGVTLFVTLTLFLVGLMFDNLFSMVLMAALSGAILGFLVFNFHPARIFLGDSGSLLLGFLVAALSLLASRKAETAVALLIPVVALGLPIMDTALAVLRRWYKRLPLEGADRQHIHHTLLGLGWSHRRAVLVLYSVCLALGLSAVLITFERSEVTVVVLGVLSLLAFVCIRVFGQVKLTDLAAKFTRERRSRQRESAALASLERVAQMMHTAEDIDDLWGLCSEALEHLSLDRAELRLHRGRPAAEIRVWTRLVLDVAGKGESDSWSGHLNLAVGGKPWGQLDVFKCVSHEPLHPSTPHLLDRLRDELTLHLARLADQPEPVAPADVTSDEPWLMEAAV